MNALMQTAARAILWVSLSAGVAFWSSDVSAQDTESSSSMDGESGEEERSTTFRSVSGPEIQRVPGGRLLVYAYGLAWLMILSFMWRRVGKLQKTANEDLQRLQKMIDKND